MGKREGAGEGEGGSGVEGGVADEGREEEGTDTLDAESVSEGDTKLGVIAEAWVGLVEDLEVCRCLAGPSEEGGDGWGEGDSKSK